MSEQSTGEVLTVLIPLGFGQVAVGSSHDDEGHHGVSFWAIDKPEAIGKALLPLGVMQPQPTDRHSVIITFANLDALAVVEKILKATRQKMEGKATPQQLADCGGPLPESAEATHA